MPVIDGQLTSDECGALTVSVLEHFEPGGHARWPGRGTMQVFGYS